MDKTHNTPIAAKNRQGFALLITLSVLAVVIALTTILLSYFEKVQQDSAATKALIQADIYHTNITNIFQSIKNKETLFSVLYTTALPLRTEDERFSLVLQCTPLYKGVNINWLALGNDTKRSLQYTLAQGLFETLAQEYSLEDAGRLQEMLIEEIGSKNKLVVKEQSRLHQKNGIISYRQFAGILSRYQLEVDDPQIGTVPWEKYFSFSPKAEKIDAKYSSPELLSYLFYMDVETVKEWSTFSLEEPLEEKGTLESFVVQNGGDYDQWKSILAGEVFLEAAECSVGYTVAQKQYGFGFEYIDGEAKDFEFYGKY